MTARAHVVEDYLARSLRIHLLDTDDSGYTREVVTFPEQPVRVAYEGVSERDQYGVRPDERNLGLAIPEHYARALYEALADHFGHAGHDARALRRDYDAERKRVDRLIDVMVKDVR